MATKKTFFSKVTTKKDPFEKIVIKDIVSKKMYEFKKDFCKNFKWLSDSEEFVESNFTFIERDENRFKFKFSFLNEIFDITYTVSLDSETDKIKNISYYRRNEDVSLIKHLANKYFKRFNKDYYDNIHYIEKKALELLGKPSSCFWDVKELKNDSTYICRKLKYDNFNFNILKVKNGKTYLIEVENLLNNSRFKEKDIYFSFTENTKEFNLNRIYDYIVEGGLLNSNEEPIELFNEKIHIDEEYSGEFNKLALKFIELKDLTLNYTSSNESELRHFIHILDKQIVELDESLLKMKEVIENNKDSVLKEIQKENYEHAVNILKNKKESLNKAKKAYQLTQSNNILSNLKVKEIRSGMENKALESSINHKSVEDFEYYIIEE